jgi:hypothetical protein
MSETPDSGTSEEAPCDDEAAREAAWTTFFGEYNMSLEAGRELFRKARFVLANLELLERGLELDIREIKRRAVMGRGTTMPHAICIQRTFFENCYEQAKSRS